MCHEVNEDVVAALESDPVDLLVSYHPVLFAPTNRLLAGRSSGARAFRLITAGVAVLVTHTDFDAAPGGTADALAGIFDLSDVKPFGLGDEGAEARIGRYGSFDGTLGDVAARVTERLGPEGLRVSGDPGRRVETLAVVPGSGSSFIDQASEVAQALVTGDVSHHRCVRAGDMGLAVVDPGHTATERPGMSSLVELVAEVVGGEIRDLTGIDPQTWGESPG